MTTQQLNYKLGKQEPSCIYVFQQWGNTVVMKPHYETRKIQVTTQLNKSKEILEQNIEDYIRSGAHLF